jgi:hypothetical protein
VKVLSSSPSTEKNDKKDFSEIKVWVTPTVDHDLASKDEGHIQWAARTGR